MSTYYDFMVEAKYEGKWYNIDFHTKVFVNFVNLVLYISCNLVAGDIVFHLVRAIEQPFKIIEIPGYIEALQSKTILSAFKSTCK